MKWSSEQELAINTSDKNIIVSAGAGSGKTAVLTERVIRKLKKGININELLILTFTNEAASEMKKRIRKAISEDNDLINQLPLVEQAYITTFDSYTMSILKKYYYLVGLSKKINIIDSVSNNKIKNSIIDKVFNELYINHNSNFEFLIKSLCVKSDNEVRNGIKYLYDKVIYVKNYQDYLLNYMNNYKSIDEEVSIYLNYLNSILDEIKNKINDIRCLIDNTEYEKLITNFKSFDNVKNYQDYFTFVNFLDTRKIRVKNGSEECIKEEYESLRELIKKLKLSLLYSDENELKNDLEITKKISNIVVELLIKYDKELTKYKYSNNLFDYIDVELLAIKIIRDNKDIRESIANGFKEILIDEYQDTNNIQDEFINLINNNNTYLVGDVKQAIYGFRDANPSIFLHYYDEYNNNNGMKIDMNNNYRSNNYVLDIVNKIFSNIMNKDNGGVEYNNLHKLFYANKLYESNNEDKMMSLLTYNSKEIEYDKRDFEAFVIGNDIKNRVNNKYKVMNKDGSIRDSIYSDYCILVDKSTNFERIAKIFNYLNIPLIIYKSVDIKDSVEILTLKNIFNLVIGIYNKDILAIKTSLTGVLRSFINKNNDDLIMDMIINNTYMDNDLYKKAFNLVKCVENVSASRLLELIIDEYEIYDKLVILDEIDIRMIRIDEFIKVIKNLELTNNILEINNDLDNIFKDERIEVKTSVNNSDGVKLMTIHNSKGLEFSVVYYPYLDSKYNIDDIKNKYLLDKDNHFILPIFNEGVKENFYKLIFKEKFYQELKSEKVRLFYVALTRAKEKIIMLYDEDKKEERSFHNFIKENIDILNSYIKRIDINELDIVNIDYYVFNKLRTIPTLIKEDIEDINYVSYRKLESYKYSKNENNVINEDLENKLSFGTMIHYILEIIDFNKPNYDIIGDVHIKEKVKAFLNNDIFDNIRDSRIIKEYEFVYLDELNKKRNGIIDLMLIYDDHVDLIDYKLKNIDDEGYNKQLNGYRDYLKTIMDKDINLYLYSIIDERMKKIE